MYSAYKLNKQGDNIQLGAHNKHTTLFWVIETDFQDLQGACTGVSGSYMPGGNEPW